MSRAQARQELADALSTVTGFRGYPRKPRSPKKGDGWPMWRGRARADGEALAAQEDTWALVIFIGGDAEQADAFVDEHEDALDEALDPVMFVQTYAPVVVATEGGDATALMITGIRE